MNLDVVFTSLLEASVRVLLVAGFIAVALAVFRVKAPAVRHAAWTAVVVTMVALPMVQAWVPTYEVPLSWPRASAAAPSRVLNTTATVAPQSRDAAAAPATQSVRASATQEAASSVRPSTGQAVVRAQVLSAETSQPRDWRTTAVLIWLMVAAVFLLREAIGWRMAHRLAQEGVPTGTGDGTYHSERIATPVVTGVLQPRVMVPSSWPAWGSGVRGMVLEHERAHVHRRDPLVAALARVNRSIFWFHPMAWWMERHLSRLAERACDEVAMRAVQDTRLYAALLVEMAHRLQQHGQRVAWQGIGIVSSRRFEDRLDQILQGPAPAMSLRAKGALGISCGVLMVAAIACGTAAAPLAEDPELAKHLAANAANFANYEAAIAMNLDQAIELEKVAASNPDDLNAASKLLTFYLSKGQKLMGWNAMRDARRPHLLRMIARHPESDLVTWRLSRRADPEGYEQARTLWLAHVKRPDVTSEILSRAATFFERVEKPLAEEILIKAQAIDPKGQTFYSFDGETYRLAWSRRLGVLYAMAIVGSDDETSWDEVMTVNASLAKGAFATEARRKLDQSNDVAMLVGAAGYLYGRTAEVKLDFDARALGLSYARRALQIKPDSREALRIAGGPEHDADYQRAVHDLRGSVSDIDETRFDQLSEAMKLEYASGLLWAPYGRARMQEYPKKDLKAVAVSLANFKRRAEVFQGLNARRPPSAERAALEIDLHIAFGTMAMRQGDRKEAARRLGLAAAAASAAGPAVSPREQQVEISSGALQLAHDLLTAGERESVAAYFDVAGRILEEPYRTHSITAAAAIRAGKMPASYQRSLARFW